MQEALLRRIAVLGVFALLLSGCGDGGGGAAVTQTSSVHGTVKDINTGRGISGVRVTIGPRTGTTDASGRFTIRDVPAGRQSIAVSKPGYSIAGSLPATIQVYGASTTLTTIYMYRGSDLPPAPQF